MSARLRGIARQTQDITAIGRYVSAGGRTVTIAEEVAAARAAARLHGPEPLPVTPGTGRVTAFEVTGESTTAAARRLTTRDPAPVAVLSFASARNPGGGFLNGAQAQEEALCRASALHATLLEIPEYYAHHRADRSPFYSDRVIHSPAVPVFRDDRGTLLDTPFTVGFLTSPAPNAGVIARTAPQDVPLIPAALTARAERVLQTAVAAGYRRLVLGAWGCGVFRNDPAQVAGAFRALLTGEGPFAGHFDEITFAVLDRTKGQGTLTAFERAFRAGAGHSGGVTAGAGDVPGPVRAG
ncbi:TIGR02452 family protein [Streptomyces yaizuensis]|uniref:TIGR02452 family protein n=1 Tax=Streptomyces yaizuensis TaxID=2989713 RepID=A0ABQ5NR20_9ACTN|nr:TIGR02452 family protein [Streptomyces sp. YSPA8]GLF92809.1 TIGR02452 family protein [Streptomyces sp. YSPA8]